MSHPENLARFVMHLPLQLATRPVGVPLLAVVPPKLVRQRDLAV